MLGRPSPLPADPSPASCSWVRHSLQLSAHRLSVLERLPFTPGQQPAIVLLHGLVAEADTFRRLMRLLPSDRRILAVDMPGAGYSERPTTADVTFTGLAELVREAFAALQLHQPVLLGHSHGGAVALALAAQSPEALSALILLAPAHPFSTQENTLIRFYLSRPGHLFAQMLPHVPRWLFLAAFRNMPGTHNDFGYRELAPYLHTIRTPGTVPHILRMLHSWLDDMASLASSLRRTQPRIPALLLWGDRDYVVPASTSRLLMETLPRSTLVVLHNLGHLPNDEDPAATAAAINHWLATCPEDPASTLDLSPQLPAQTPTQPTP
jgi:pimeloyl-ACP methyl ester carboxylesterase